MNRLTISAITLCITFGMWFILEFIPAYASEELSAPQTTATPSPTPVDTTGPTFPIAGITFVNITPAGFKAQWVNATDNVTGMFGIRYEMCIATTVSGCDTFTAHATSQPGVAHITATRLTPSTTYHVKVRAIDGAGNVSTSLLTGTVTTAADTTGPSFSASSVTFPRVANGYVARWNAAIDNATPASAITYEVCIATTATGCTIFTVTTTTAAGVTSITRSGLLPNTTYYIKVRARDATGNVSTNMATGNLRTAADVDAPVFSNTTLNFIAGPSTTFAASWNAASDTVTSAARLVYVVCIGTTVTDCDSYPIHFTTSAGITSILRKGLNQNTTYYVTVWARDAAGNMSVNSASGSVTTDVASPTSTRTFTRTRTNTPTRTATRTRTNTPTQTATMTASNTRTNTPTFTASNTRTATSTATNTRTATATATMTSTPQPNQLIAPGGQHTCLLTTAGSVACWGYNLFGQLGNGTTASSFLPVAVTGLSSGVTAVSAGNLHTCAITAVGGLKCWGINNGRLGDGTVTQRTTPVDVVGLTSNVIAVSASDTHTCALTSSGGVKCWGSNGSGQLGDGSQTSRSAPVDVVGLTGGVVAIATGEFHTCALTSSGGVKCWGMNSSGRLGDGTSTTRTTPVDVVNMTSGVIAITAGDMHTCALKSAGSVSVYCWGYNGNGQIGDGTQTSRNTPALVSELNGSGVAAITAGERHTCVRTTAGAVLCWGNNINGQIGDGTFTTRYIPTAVVGLTSGVVSLAAGESHTCAIVTGNRGMCWGGNFNGEVGDGTVVRRNTPVNIIGYVP